MTMSKMSVCLGGAFVKNVLLSVAVAVAILPMAVSAATTYYVATYGDDSNAGTSWDCPFKTIEAGVAAVKNGAGAKELIISNGTYVLTQTIGNPTSGSVAMRSLTGDPKDVILDAALARLCDGNRLTIPCNAGILLVLEGKK